MTAAHSYTHDHERARVDDAARWAIRLADGGWTAEPRADLEAWLEADTRNGALLEEITAAWRAVDNYATHEEIMAMRQSALASARREMRRKNRGSRLLSWLPLTAAVCSAVLLTVVPVLLWLAPQTYATGIGERRVAILPDGSKIFLDGASRVRVRFSNQRRQLWLLSGRARFDVAKDPARPFIVSAADKKVVATGTAFSVELIQKQVRVVLYEGKVALLESTPSIASQRNRPIQIDQVSAEKLLTPGKQIVLPDNSPADLNGTVASVKAADVPRSLAWEGGELVFDDEPLGAAVEQMNRYAEKPLVIGDVAASRLRISGVFHAGDTGALVQGLAANFGVKAREEPKSIALFGPPGGGQRSLNSTLR